MIKLYVFDKLFVFVTIVPSCGKAVFYLLEFVFFRLNFSICKKNEESVDAKFLWFDFEVKRCL